MYLDKLIIRAGSDVIREISFKQGLNLIVDETGTSSTDSGNNVGKTSFLRAIDFCLGGQKDNIYSDKEFRRKNQKLYDFLTTKDVVFELFLTSKKGIKHHIVRPIEGKSSIDDKEMSSEPKFCEALQTILFGTAGGRPTLGQLMNKFIRVEDYQLNNALYFLHPTSDRSEYEALFMFLFGFRDTELLGRKRKVVDKVKKYSKNLEESNNTVEDLEQQLHLIDKDIVDLEKIKNAHDFVKGVDVELESLKKLQGNISELKATVAKLNLKKEMNSEALRQLKESKSSLTVDSIAALYKQAKIELPSLGKKFEEVLGFHNQMIDNKVKFLERVLKDVDKALEENRNPLNSYLAEESKIIGVMSSKGALDEYDKISLKLQDKNREKGAKEALIANLNSVVAELAKCTKELDELNAKLEEFASQFNNNLKQFNVDFSELSNKLYGDKYYLATKRENNKTTDNYLLDIGNMSENIGTGKKKAQISAIDLAYLKYSEASAFTLPLFVLHDQLETVFENQIETLFDVANSLKGQFIVAVLSDKLRKMDRKDIEANCILRLSQTDKLFKIP